MFEFYNKAKLALKFFLNVFSFILHDFLKLMKIIMIYIIKVCMFSVYQQFIIFDYNEMMEK